ncbi:hypothetical protein [Klebsiella pneumoniae]|uniref:hypothetical protein n=1 Tax=Klebsiella pneumoniae TaxID=573 RepID=UPI00215181D8|nr:hypothetical protein [Klebsiella pneumoniae]MCR6126312.1 hypothetical protein [Klebsiella pneumoniae]
MGFYAPDEGTFVLISILSYALYQLIDVLWKPAIFVFLGIITVAGWYFTELQPKLRGEGKVYEGKNRCKTGRFR